MLWHQFNATIYASCDSVKLYATMKALSVQISSYSSYFISKILQYYPFVWPSRQVHDHLDKHIIKEVTFVAGDNVSTVLQNLKVSMDFIF